MNICCLSIVTYWHGIKGGLEVHGKLLCERLVEMGHNVTIISTNHPEKTEFEERKGIKLYYLQDTTFGSKRGGWKTASTKKFIELGKINHFDIVFSMSASISRGLIAAVRKRKSPLIVISEGPEITFLISEVNQVLYHGSGFRNLTKIFLAFLYYYFFWEFAFRKCDAVITVSREMANTIKKWHFVGKEKIFTVNNCAETNRFYPDQTQRERTRKELAITDKEKVLLFFSSITKQKGAHLLIKALQGILKTNDQVKLMIVGDGDYLSGAKQLVKLLGLETHVIFTGFASREKAPHYINASDIFILPTLRMEGMPFSVLEAMACQKPVIASRIGGIISIIDDGVEGLLIPPGNIPELIKKILFLLNNKNFADKLATNAREKIIQKFSVDNMAEETVKIFESAITRKNE
ncbi:MAG: glycosyltransferase family 4 protein [Planctomycetota bacterium]